MEAKTFLLCNGIESLRGIRFDDRKDFNVSAISAISIVDDNFSVLEAMAGLVTVTGFAAAVYQREATALLQRMLGGESAPDATLRTTARIALIRREPRVPPSTSDIVPKGARFIEGAYRNPAGSRAYRLFIPSRCQGQALPLIVMLHGATQSPDDFAAGTRMNFIAEEQSCFVVYPAQRCEANQAKCWNWFRTADQQRGRGEPSLIAGITHQIMRDYSVDPKRVYVGGLSAGAAAAAIMGATYNDLYAAIGVHSGLACGAAIDLPSALVAMRQGGGSDDRVSPGDGPPVPTIVFHGDRDMTVHPTNGDQILEPFLRTAGTHKKVHRGQVPGGHGYTRTIHADASGRGIFEHWNIHGAGHAWSGGSPAGSYTDPQGPDATKEMLRFFLEHSLS